MVYCRNCGSEVKGNFCTNCGTPLEQDQMPAGSADSGATTVIRAEDLQNMEAQRLRDQQPAQNPAGEVQPPADQPVTPSWANPAPGSPTPSELPPSGQPAWAQPDTSSPQPPPPNWSQGSAGGQSFGGQSGGGFTSSMPGSGGTGGGFTAGGGGQSFGQFGGSMMGGGTLAIGDLISRAVNVVTSNLPLVLPAAVAYAVIYTIAQLFNGFSRATGIIGLVIEGIAYALIEAAAIYITVSSIRGEPLSLNDLVSRVVAVWPRLFGAVVVSYIAIVIGFILLVIPGFFAFFALIFVPQSVVLDGAPVFGSLRESWNIVKSDFWGIVGRVIVAILCLIVAAIVVGIVTVIVSRIPVVGSLVSGFLGGILIAWFMAYTTLMFLGMKERLGMGSQTATPAGFAG